MIHDLRTWTGDSSIECDVCIVGAGAAGLAVARELARATLDVVLLESGGETLESDTQELSAATVSGEEYTGHVNGRARALGGTTTKWGGQALPLNENDFAQRSWIAESGWPIAYASLGPFYERAGEFLGLDRDDFDTGLATALGATRPAFDPAVLHAHFSKWIREPNLWRVHADELRRAPRVTIIQHANVTRLTLDDANRVADVEARSLDGRVLRVRPRATVLATGALEVPRLLLANRDQRPAGIGNEHDLVGRYLQDHPGAVLGTVQAIDERAVQERYNVYLRDGLRYAVRFALTPGEQRRQRLASASGNLMFIPREGSGFEAAKALYREIAGRRPSRRALGYAARMVTDLPAVVRTAASFRRGRVYTPNAEILLIGTCEQEPDRDSRVLLSAERDALGMQRLDIRWRVSPLTRRTMRVFAETARAQIESAGDARVHVHQWVLDEGTGPEARFADHYHPMGTTRMSDMPTNGVVDPDCRVHSTANLYVASSAVFPTGGFSNPTMTIIALAIRLADRLRSTLSRRSDS